MYDASRRSVADSIGGYVCVEGMAMNHVSLSFPMDINDMGKTLTPPPHPPRNCHPSYRNTLLTYRQSPHILYTSQVA